MGEKVTAMAPAGQLDEATPDHVAAQQGGPGRVGGREGDTPVDDGGPDQKTYFESRSNSARLADGPVREREDGDTPVDPSRSEQPGSGVS